MPVGLDSSDVQTVHYHRPPLPINDPHYLLRIYQRAWLNESGF